MIEHEANITIGLTENKTEGNTTLGYALNVSDESKKKDIKVANCLIPTSVSLQTYPFKAHPTADPKLGWSGDAARNCIVYADMTENRKVSGDKMLRWSGNFTTLQFDKEGLVDGSMCIRRDLFLGRFIVPMLRQYNDDMQIIAKTSQYSTVPPGLSLADFLPVEIRRDGGAGDRKFHWTYRSDLGYNEDHPDWKSSYFDFRENAQV